jgi:hypothetical protein
MAVAVEIVDARQNALLYEQNSKIRNNYVELQNFPIRV